MKSIDLFYQGEGVGEIAHIELEPDATFAVLKARLVEKHGSPPMRCCSSRTRTSRSTMASSSRTAPPPRG